MIREEIRIMEKPYWEGKEYSYFSHKKCEYFPCHKGADPENFNCLFCYCPLYALADMIRKQRENSQTDEK